MKDRPYLPTWRIDQIRVSALADAEYSFARLIKNYMQLKGWKYVSGNNEFIKGSFALIFSNGYGIFTRSDNDGRNCKIVHRFKVLPNETRGKN